MRRACLTRTGLVLLALAGCAPHPAVQAKAPPAAVAAVAEPPPEQAAPEPVVTARHARRHRALAHRGGHPDWTVACDDRPRGRSDCRIETVLRPAGPTAPEATISSNDGGKTWVVAATPAPGAARLSVGQHKPVDADCSMPGTGCAIIGPAAAELTHDLQSGARLHAQVLTTDGQLRGSVSLRGFSRQLTKLRRRLPADAGAPVSPAPGAGPSPTPDSLVDGLATRGPGHSHAPVSMAIHP
jgi:invasion protein IalB